MICELKYPSKPSERHVLSQTESALFDTFGISSKKLIRGDNLHVLQFLRKNGYAGNIDLIYIDPPFATKNVFTVGNERTRTMSRRDLDTIAYSDTMVGIEYLEFIRKRLIFAKELLSEHGSIYLHIDYKIGHYIKILMDEVFGEKNFRNDISRIKCNPKNFSRNAFGNIKDMVLFYSKGDNPIWNEPRLAFSSEELERLYKKKDEKGRAYTTIPLHAPGETKNGLTAQAFHGLLPPVGRHWRCPPAELEDLDRKGLIEWSKTGVPRKIIYADSQTGKKIQDIWEYKDSQNPSYPTEKNLKMLHMIVSASSLPESTVLDFFCGSGTTLVAAQELGRNWIGIDNSEAAISTVKRRLAKFNNELWNCADYDFCQQIDSIKLC